ncbi:NUDIX hydrolase N-terminal domain-containing protein [Acidothermaceae bacterium B102]|nr:NUDIX hydrolase N-terminal domain-containing protein [Acidothermaceae bacterium B102]
MDDAERVRRVAIALAAMSQTGLAFTVNEYDRHRYVEAGALAAELLSVVSGLTVDVLSLELGRDVGYATPKVDVRGAIFDADDRVLLMRERSDGRWSLPGGWADPLDTPSAAVVREIREETGYGATVVSLVGCWDRDTQGHVPRLPVSVYKLFFLCRLEGAAIEPEALETLEVGWFGLAELPELSLGRVNLREIERCLAHHRDPSLPTELD